MDQITVALHDAVFAVGDRSGDLSHPEAVRTLCDAAKLNAPRRELDEEENHKALKSSLRPNFDGKKVCGHDLVAMPFEEFCPCRFSLPFWRGLDAVTS